MKIRVVALILALILMLGGAAYASEGSQDSFVKKPVQTVSTGLKPIGSREAFLNMKNSPNGSYYLTKDIDLGVWDEPFAFSGSLYGNGYTISYTSPAKMAVDSAYDYGLFSVIDYANVENLRISARIDNAYQGAAERPLHIGALAGRSTNGAFIYNCVADVRISVSTVEWMNESRTAYQAVEAADPSGLWAEQSTTAVGGLIGYADNQDGDILFSALIFYSRCTGSVSGADSTGGMIGECAGDVYIMGCENSAKVTGVNCVGGFVGKADTSCTVLQSANRGNVTAYGAYAGGFVGSGMTVGNDEISDCINLGVVTLVTVNGMGDTAGQFTGSGTIPVKRCVYSGKLVAGIAEDIPEFDEDIFDTIYVWSKDDGGDFYPRVLLGEDVNQYRAGYVRKVRELCEKSAVNDVGNYLFTVNPAMTFAEYYREAGLPEVHVFWYEFDKNVTGIMNFDLDALKDVSLYDMMLADLIMMDENHKEQNKDVENALLDGFLESIKQPNEMLGGILIPGTVYLESLISIHSGTGDKLFADAIADSDDALFAKAMEHYGFAEMYEGISGPVNKLSTASFFLGLVLDAMEAYNSYNDKADQERMLREAYLQSFDRYERIFSGFCATNETPYLFYDDPYQALRHVLEMDDAIYMLRQNMEQQALEYDSAALQAAFAAGKGVMVEMISGTLLSTAGLQLLGYAPLYTAAASVGLTVAEAMHIDEVSYNGLMLNCAAYMSDGLQHYVQKKYNEFMQEKTYENAQAFAESMSLYLDLQILSCKYALKSALISRTDGFFFDKLRAREVDIRAVRGLFDDL